MTVSQADRLRGCILGGALGDTIGLFTEFLSKSKAEEIYGQSPHFTILPEGHGLCPPQAKRCYMDRHRALFELGAWTDDTDQTLLILLSFLRSGGKELDPIDFAKRLRIWMQNGILALGRPPLGLGRTVGAVVGSEGYLDDPIGAARKRWEDTGRGVAANGAVMRTCIVGALIFQDLGSLNGMEQTFKSAISIASTTHADPRCLISCALASGLVAALMQGEIHDDDDIRKVLNAAVHYLNTNYPESALSAEHLEEMNTHVWANDLPSLKLDERDSIGYTYKALGAGIWALRKALKERSLQHRPGELFESIITELTMAGGDADTNCAVAGPLVGALIGSQMLPKYWLEGLKHRDWLFHKANAAIFLLGIENDSPYKLLEYDWENDNDTLIDAGKGEMSKEQIDAMWKVLIENMHERLGQKIPPGPHAKSDKTRKRWYNFW